MSFLNKIFSRENPNLAMRPLYDAIVKEGRRPDWYIKGDVPDTLDGRFDMIATIFCLVLFQLEKVDGREQQTAWLTEHFVTDMDGQLRQIGIGDMVVGKHIKRMMGALGGRLGAYREAFLPDGDLDQALVRNLYRGEAPPETSLDFVTSSLREFHSRLEKCDVEAIVAGQLPEIV